MKRLLLLIPAILMIGCSINPPIRPHADPYDREQLHVDSTELKHDTAMGQPIAVLNESGLLTVTVPIRSVINKTLYVDYSVTFFDRNGVQVEHFGPFTKTLDPNTPDQIQVASTTRQAADFQISFRYAR